MTNPHIQAAVEAGAKALNVLAVAQGALDDWDQWAAEAEATLDAMLPHLRAMIAQEILEAARASADSQQKHDLENGYWDGIGTTSPNAQQWHQAGNWASNTILKNGPTQIAKGPQQ